jgi:hypothetical protein
LNESSNSIRGEFYNILIMPLQRAGATFGAADFGSVTSAALARGATCGTFEFLNALDKSVESP